VPIHQALEISHHITLYVMPWGSPRSIFDRQASGKTLSPSHPPKGNDTKFVLSLARYFQTRLHRGSIHMNWLSDLFAAPWSTPAARPATIAVTRGPRSGFNYFICRPSWQFLLHLLKTSVQNTLTSSQLVPEAAFKTPEGEKFNFNCSRR
jgi:hypothetical protein